ncbi:MAG: heparinase II/III family protein, partial [Armatimonadota bacterium]
VQGAPGGGDEDRKAVEVGILTPAGEVLSSWMDKMMVHNMSCWANAALALLGRHLDRSDWLEKALHSERAGLQLLLTRGVPPDPKTGRPDGFWHEASTFYNFYALIPLIPLYRVGEEEGAVDDEMRAHFRAMFGAPLHLVDCNLRLLTVGDRAGPGQLSLTHFRHVYEYAAGQVDTERYGPLLSLLYEKCGAPRTSLAALAWGPDELPPPCDLPRESAVLGGARMVTFRKPSRWGDLALWFVGGEENNGGQAHHHHDKLSFSFHAGGEIVSSDLGLPSFQDNVWAMFLCGTFSHNTLLVDEVSQGPMESLEFEADLQSDVPWAHAAVCGNRDDGRGSLWKTMLQRGDDVREGAHDDVVLARTILFDPPYIVLSDRGEAPDERRFSSVLHARGDMIVEAAPAPDAAAADMLPLPSEGAFGLLVDRAVANPVEQVTVDWRICDGLWLRLVATGDGPLEATWGRTPGNPRWETRGTIVLRGPGRTRRFGAVLELHSGSPTVRSVNLHEDEGVILTPYEGPPKVYSRPARAAEGEGRSA